MTMMRWHGWRRCTWRRKPNSRITHTLIWNRKRITHLMKIKTHSLSLSLASLSPPLTCQEWFFNTLTPSPLYLRILSMDISFLLTLEGRKDWCPLQWRNSRSLWVKSLLQLSNQLHQGKQWQLPKDQGRMLIKILLDLRKLKLTSSLLVELQWLALRLWVWARRIRFNQEGFLRT